MDCNLICVLPFQEASVGKINKAVDYLTENIRYKKKKKTLIHKEADISRQYNTWKPSTGNLQHGFPQDQENIIKVSGNGLFLQIWILSFELVINCLYDM